jgi:hypothetical protein
MRLLCLTLLIVIAGCSPAKQSVTQRRIAPREETRIMIHQATQDHVSRMVELSALKRAQYQTHSPIFWRPAADADRLQEKFFRGLLADPSWICLVHENAGGIDGFILARLIAAPPVYDPGGKVCMIDDFAVSDSSLWPTVGMALRDAAERKSSDAGAVVSVTVCGQGDGPKRTALQNSGAHVASEWYVHSIVAGHGR